jgi:hypothetical protein
VHRRLYQDNSVAIIDLSRYLGVLIVGLQVSLDQRWKAQMSLDLASILISTDRAEAALPDLKTEVSLSSSRRSAEPHDSADRPYAAASMVSSRLRKRFCGSYISDTIINSSACVRSMICCRRRRTVSLLPITLKSSICPACAFSVGVQ